MKNILFAGIAASSLLMIAPATAASDSFASKAESGKSALLGGVFDGRRGGGPVVGPRPGGHGPVITGPGMGGNHRWGHRISGRWFAGFYAPGGWGGYRAPFRGYILPTYWVQPTYRINNFPTYGLYAPQTGYGWSRYYDDAVLTDSRGYVQDYRSNIPWDRYEGGYAPGDYAEPDFGPAMGADRGVYYGDERVYSQNGNPPPPPPRQQQQQQQQVVYQKGTGQTDYRQTDYRQSGYDQNGYYPQGYNQPDPRYSNGGYPAGQSYQSRYGFERYERCLKERGVAGGAIGAVVGAVIGNRVAGKGDRLAGSLIGGGVGALAGMGIEKATNKCKKYLPRDDSYYYSQGGYQQGGYQQGGYQGQPQYAPPPPPPQGYGYQGGYYQNGYYYPAPTVTTITIMPAVTTTTTTTTEEYVYETVSAPAKKKAVRKWKPKPKPRCGCR